MGGGYKDHKQPKAKAPEPTTTGPEIHTVLRDRATAILTGMTKQLQSDLGAAVAAHATMVVDPSRRLDSSLWQPVAAHAVAMQRAESWLHQQDVGEPSDPAEAAAYDQALASFQSILAQGREFQARIERWKQNPGEGAAAQPDQRPPLRPDQDHICAEPLSAQAGIVCAPPGEATRQLHTAQAALNRAYGRLASELAEASVMSRLMTVMRSDAGLGPRIAVELTIQILLAAVPNPLLRVAGPIIGVLKGSATKTLLASSGSDGPSRFVNSLKDIAQAWGASMADALPSFDTHELAVTVKELEAMSAGYLAGQIQAQLALFEREVMSLGKKVKTWSETEARVMWVAHPVAGRRLARFRNGSTDEAFCASPTTKGFAFVEWVSDRMVDAAVARQQALSCDGPEVMEIAATEVDHRAVREWETSSTATINP